MKTRIAITDVTRMQESRVCVAGYDRTGQCIRPVLPPPGIHERTLSQRGQPIVFPFAVVEYDFIQPTPQPPHTEDHRYDPASIQLIDKLDEKRRRAVLDRSLFNRVSAIFEEPIHSEHGHYIMDGRGPRSLGTVRPRRILRAIHEPGEGGKWKYRLGFVDSDDITYWLTVTDLTWRYFHDHERQRQTPDDVAAQITSSLRASEVYLRIGLARGWEQHPDRCYLQITGVYTFPDYLEGRTFADFALHSQ